MMMLAQDSARNHCTTRKNSSTSSPAANNTENDIVLCQLLPTSSFSSTASGCKVCTNLAISNSRTTHKRKRSHWWIEVAESSPEQYTPDRFGWSPLMEAVQQGDFARCRYLVEDLQVDVNCCAEGNNHGDGYNALFVVLLNSLMGNPTELISICKLLIDNGINLNHKCIYGLSFIQMIDDHIEHAYDDHRRQLMKLLRTLVNDRL